MKTSFVAALTCLLSATTTFAAPVAAPAAAAVAVADPSPASVDLGFDEDDLKLLAHLGLSANKRSLSLDDDDLKLLAQLGLTQASKRDLSERELQERQWSTLLRLIGLGDTGATDGAPDGVIISRDLSERELQERQWSTLFRLIGLGDTGATDGAPDGVIISRDLSERELAERSDLLARHISSLMTREAIEKRGWFSTVLTLGALFLGSVGGTS